MSVTNLVAADTLAAIKTGFLLRGAVEERGTGGIIDGGEAPSTFTYLTTRIGQAQLGTSAIVFGTGISSWGKWVK